MTYKFTFFNFLVVTVSFERNTYTVTEGEGQVEVCVDLSGPIERPVTVRLQSFPGNASNHSGAIRMKL